MAPYPATRNCRREQRLARARCLALVGLRTKRHLVRFLYATGAPASPNARGLIVSDLARTKRRDRTVSCPRCGTTMEEVVSIALSLGEPGLSGYECPNCVYVTSELVRPTDE